MNRNPNNLRTGLILGAIALAFFLSVFVKRIWFN
ncbi:MAG: cytochrome oxidase small assembly protein [Janthinobacterium lividum]